MNLFTQEDTTSQNAVDHEVLSNFLAPGAVDAFLGVGMETEEMSNADEAGESVRTFDIPHELLQTYPIAEVGPNTKIIAINAPVHTITKAMAEKEVTTPAPAQAGPSGIGQAGPSGIGNVNRQEEPMDVVNPSIQTAKQPQNAQQEEGGNNPQTQGAPKKGYVTKNRKGKPEKQLETHHDDDTLKERISVLGEITNLMKNAYGARKNELHVWGNYIGLKAERVPEGKGRDKLLVKVEKLMNDAIYGENTVEE